MNCPSCSIALQMTERKNVEIDYCPKCRGVWLDRGELDKLLETASAQASPPAHASTYDGHHEGRRDRRDDDRGHDKRHSKKKGFLSEIFDF